MHTWQAGLKWRRVVHWGKLSLLLTLSLSLSFFNLKMPSSFDKMLLQEWVSSSESNSSLSWAGIDLPFASSSFLSQALPGFVTTAEVDIGARWKCFYWALTRWMTEYFWLVVWLMCKVRFLIDDEAFYVLVLWSVIEEKQMPIIHLSPCDGAILFKLVPPLHLKLLTNRHSTFSLCEQRV